MNLRMKRFVTACMPVGGTWTFGSTACRFTVEHLDRRLFVIGLGTWQLKADCTS
jgi:hypothetical protein